MRNVTNALIVNVNVDVDARNTGRLGARWNSCRLRGRSTIPGRRGYCYAVEGCILAQRFKGLNLLFESAVTSAGMNVEKILKLFV